MKRSLMLVVGLALFASYTFGQEPPKPGPEHEMLKKLVGTWDAEMSVQGQTTKALMVYKSICDGMWLQSEFTGEFFGQKFTGHGLDGYNAGKKKYVNIWVDNAATSPLISEGTFDEKTKTLTMAGEITSQDGKAEKSLSKTVLTDDDHMTFVMNLVGPDGAEQKLFSIEYTRRK